MKSCAQQSSISDASDIFVKTPITIVVPCFNEAATLLHLRNTLRSVKQSLAKNYEVHLILVDDQSTDPTWQSLQHLFGDEPDCQLISQPRNLGVAATIATGIRNANTEIVCSIDCDGTYDPHQLEKFLPLLTDGVDLVTASPYHPLGQTFSVPAWRLALSRTASAIYRRVLRNKLHTYTSCFRVYRRSAILDCELENGGFLGITELIGKLDQKGSVIVECPATLEATGSGTVENESPAGNPGPYPNDRPVCGRPGTAKSFPRFGSRPFEII